MTIDEVKRHLLVISDDVLGNDMVDLYEAQNCCDTSFRIGYNKSIDDFVEHITLPITTEEQISEIVEQLKKEN